MAQNSSLPKTGDPIFTPFNMEGAQNTGTVQNAKFTLASIMGKGRLRTAYAIMSTSTGSPGVQLTITADGVKIFDGKIGTAANLVAGIVQEEERMYTSTTGFRTPSGIAIVGVSANIQPYPYTALASNDVWTPIDGEIVFNSSVLVEATQLLTSAQNCYFRVSGVKA